MESRIAAVLAANAEFQIGRAPATAFDRRCCTSSPTPSLIESLEWIARDRASCSTYALRNVPASSRLRPKSRLRQIVRAEREELGRVGDLVGGQSGARQFDHRADEIVRTSRRVLAEHLLRHRLESPADQIQLVLDRRPAGS